MADGHTIHVQVKDGVEKVRYIGVNAPEIPFCASLYSVGLPPELLGLTASEVEDGRWLVESCPAVAEDLREACRYLDPETLDLLPDGGAVRAALARLDLEVPALREHREITRAVRRQVEAGRAGQIGPLIVQAAWLRRFLG